MRERFREANTTISSSLVTVGSLVGDVGVATTTAVGMTKSSKKNKNSKNEKRMQQKNSGVAETSLIHISKLLEQFRESQNDVYTFEANLNNKERAVIHEACRKMGFSSKSAGRGDQRQISVFKNKKKGAPKKEKERVISVEFSKESKMVLHELFTRFPPGISGTRDEFVDVCSKKTDKFNGKRDDIFSRVPFGKAEILKKVDMLASKIAKTPKLRQIAEERSNLPIATFENDIISTMNSNQVVLVCGETGCGKTTQVPQYILDNIWCKGENCKIVCTQPRRISAISVAERISNERGESVGGTVGYKIRLECKGDKNSSIVFCTNGVLLKVLVSRVNPKSNVSRASSQSTLNKITDITHIVADEIHERDWSSDFMIAILRDILPSNPQLRLILMSATVDTERFSQYFGGCPIIHVPGFTHPVRTFYLEDALALVNPGKNNDGNTQRSSVAEMDGILDQYRSVLDEAITLACESDEVYSILEILSSQRTASIFNYRHSSTGVTPLMVLAGKGDPEDIYMLLSFGADMRICDSDGLTALDWAEHANRAEVVDLLKKHSQSCSNGQSLVDKYLESINQEIVDDDLIEKLLRKICCNSTDGAVLVFLPGWDDINRTRERLNSSPFFRNQSKFVIIPLHSMVPSIEQKKVFKRVPSGCRKIVLSTNIAETAVTIDDVVCVIDSGRMKEKSYDPYSKVSTLQSSWVSKASAKQREGRAGRCQPGVCYHLYSKIRAESLPDFQVPEIRRMPIEELCLQIKLLDQDCRIETFLQKTLDPPISEAITNGIALLQDIGALSTGEKLTDFGRKLGLLPVHPSTGKMLLFAISMNCLDPALTLACASDYRDPFTLPMFPEEKKKAATAKAELSSLYRAHSDQLAVVAGFECWKNAKECGEEAHFCSQYFISGGAMNMLSGMRKQLQTELVRQGFLPEDESPLLNSNTRDSGVLHAVLMAGMYPMVGILHGQLKYKNRFYINTASGEKVGLNQHSVCSKMILKPYESRPLMAYDEVMRGGGGMTVKNCTVVGPLPFMLFAKDIAVAPPTQGRSGEEDEDIEEKGEGQPHGGIMSCPENTVTVIVDGWAHFTSTALAIAHIYCLRERLSAAIMFLVKHPGKPLPAALSESVSAIVGILSSDAFAGLSPTIVPGVPPASAFSSTMFGKNNPTSGSSVWSFVESGRHRQEREPPVPRMLPRPQRLLRAWHGQRTVGYSVEGTDHTQRTRGGTGTGTGF